MTNLFSQDQVRDLCLSVGFEEKNARIASAIALCEAPAMLDGFPHTDFDAVGDQELADDIWGNSYGAFQIRSLRSQKGTGGPRDELELRRPRFNVRSARIIKLGSGFGAWSTYASGMYKAYLQDIFPPEPGTYLVVFGDTLSGIADAFGTFSWEELARVNNIHAPYSIYIGQSLTLPAAP